MSQESSARALIITRGPIAFMIKVRPAIGPQKVGALEFAISFRGIFIFAGCFSGPV